MIRRFALVAVSCAAGFLAVAPGALGSGAQVVADCNAHGKLTQEYPVAQLRTALSTMPADIKEYTDCYDVIQRSLLAAVGKLPGGGAPTSSSSGGSLLPTGVVIALVVLGLAAATGAAVAVRRRR